MTTLLNEINRLQTHFIDQRENQSELTTRISNLEQYEGSRIEILQSQKAETERIISSVTREFNNTLESVKEIFTKVLNINDPSIENLNVSQIDRAISTAINSDEYNENYIERLNQLKTLKQQERSELNI